MATKKENEKNTEVKKSTEKKVTPVKQTKKANNNIPINIICALVGLILGLGIMYLFFPERIAKTSSGTDIILEVAGKNITSDDLYKSLKDSNGLATLLQEVDKKILDKKYTLNKDQLDEVNSQVEYYLNMYKNYYGYTEKQFLESNGFKDKEEFTKYVEDQYKNDLYYQEYLKGKISDKDIEKHYKDNVFGDIKTKYIAVAKTVDDEDANKDESKLANEILKKAKNGTSYDDLVKEYKDKITNEDLDYVAWNKEDIDEDYLKSLKSMKNNSVSSKVVETGYGYTIIFREDQKDKAKLDDIRDDIIEALKTKLDSEDEHLYNKAFIELRKENKIKFYDTELEKEYKDFIKENK